MKNIQLVIFMAFIVNCLSLMYAAGRDVAAGVNVDGIDQTSNDSIIAPNVFTPNNDGENDIFEVTSRENNVVSLKVFTRAGVLVCSIEARRCQWDGNSLAGRQMSDGIYFYTAEVRGFSPKVAKSGFVHLYR